LYCFPGNDDQKLFALLKRNEMTLPHGRAEDQLQTSPELFRKILEIATDAIISVDEDQKIVLFNQGAEQIFRYRAEEVLGQPLEFLLPPQFHEHHRAQVNEFRQSPRASRPMGERGSLFGRRKDGAIFPAEASISRVEINGGMTFTAILRDVTAVREAESAIQALNDDLRHRATQLEHAYRELEAFSYSVSHDLRAPLRSIDGFAQVLLEDYAPQLDDEGQDSLGRIRAASQQMAQLIDDILSLSRLTRGELRAGRRGGRGVTGNRSRPGRDLPDCRRTGGRCRSASHTGGAGQSAGQCVEIYRPA
jgi:PAS domain S-box-containing protein